MRAMLPDKYSPDDLRDRQNCICPDRNRDPPVTGFRIDVVVAVIVRHG